MGLKSDIDHNKGHSISENKTTRITASIDDAPPIYYDSEPSSQPPRYLINQSTQAQPKSTSSVNLQAPSNPPKQHRNSAPASTIHAILASPHVDLDAERRAERKSKTLRQRWRDFKDRNFHDDYDYAPSATPASGPEWNYKGASLKGGMVTPYRKRSGK